MTRIIAFSNIRYRLGLRKLDGIISSDVELLGKGKLRLR
jgi:hypothetical protein